MVRCCRRCRVADPSSLMRFIGFRFIRASISLCFYVSIGYNGNIGNTKAKPPSLLRLRRCRRRCRRVDIGNIGNTSSAKIYNLRMLPSYRQHRQRQHRQHFTGHRQHLVTFLHILAELHIDCRTAASRQVPSRVWFLVHRGFPSLASGSVASGRH